VRLHVEFVKLQQWVVHKVRIVFEGRDGAGKGGTIKAMTDRLEARIDDGRKTGKLSDMDLEPYSRWFDHSRAIICRQRLASSPVQNPITGSTAAPLY
jgi:polyphosphate kinase 2 (PPK2 family)